MKYHFIINPVSGRQDSSKILIPAIHQALKICGIQEQDVQITLTSRPQEARTLSEQAAQHAAHIGEMIRIFAAGGDGTFNEVLTGAMPYPNAAVGLLPYGSGNDFLRSFGTRNEFLNLKEQLQGDVVSIDTIRTQRGYAACICSAGLDAKVAYGIPKYRHLPFCGGGMAYKLSILECLMGKRSSRMSIHIDGHVFERNCLLAAVCNGRAYGGGFIAAPESKLDDGVLDVLIVKDMPLLKIAKVLPLYQSGKHFNNGQVIPELQDLVEYFPAHRVTIQCADQAQDMIVNIDGECAPDKCLSAEIMPLSAKILLPKSVYERYVQKSSSKQHSA